MVRLVVDRQIEIREVDQHGLETAMLARKASNQFATLGRRGPAACCRGDA